MKKLGLDRVRLHELSGLKKSVFDKLVLSMITLNKDMKQEMVSKPKASKRTHSFAEAVEARATGVYYSFNIYILLFATVY